MVWRAFRWFVSQPEWLHQTLFGLEPRAARRWERYETALSLKNWSSEGSVSAYLSPPPFPPPTLRSLIRVQDFCHHKVLMPLEVIREHRSGATTARMNKVLARRRFFRSHKENDGRFSMALLEATTAAMFPQSRGVMFSPKDGKTEI